MTESLLEVSFSEFIEEIMTYERSVIESSLVKTIETSTLQYNQHYNVVDRQVPKYHMKHANNYGWSQYGGGHDQDIYVDYDRATYTAHENYTTYSNKYEYVKTGFDHENYIPSVPYIYNAAQRQGVPLRDTATITLFAYDGNLQDNLGTQDTLSKEIFFSVELKKVANRDDTAVSAADQEWHTVGNFTKSPLSDGNMVTETALLLQKADNTGKTSFTIYTRNPFGKGNTTFQQEEGTYQLRVCAWNTYRSENGTSKYYISSTRYETLEFQQNYLPEVVLTNEANVLNVIFSELGVKTTTPAFKSWMDNVYNDPYADANNQIEGVFLKFAVRDQDPENTQWQQGKAVLKKSDGTVIKEVAVFFSEDTGKGETVVQSNGDWKKGYAYFDKTVLPVGADLTGCSVSIEIRDYLNAACTNAVGTYAVQSVNLDIDTEIPVIANVTQTTAGLNTSTVKAGAGISNAVYEMRFRLQAIDSHPNTKLRSVRYAISGGTDIPGAMTSATLDAAGYFTTPPITENGTYYVHVYAQDYAGNEHRAVYGPYTRAFEPTLSGAGVYLSEMKTAGKTHGFAEAELRNPSDLGLPLSGGLRFGIQQGYAFTLRVVGTHINHADMSVTYNGMAIPARFLGYRKYELPGDGSAILPGMTNAGNLSSNILSVSDILPPLIADPDGHLVCDSDSVYVAEYQLYLHRDAVLNSGSNVGRALGLSLTLYGHHVYPDGNPMASETVFTQVDLSDVFLITGHVSDDGGTNLTN